MISKKVDLNEVTTRPLLDDNNNPMFISTDKEVELSFKEAEAIAEGIIYYFKINSKKN